MSTRRFLQRRPLAAAVLLVPVLLLAVLRLTGVTDSRDRNQEQVARDALRMPLCWTFPGFTNKSITRDGWQAFLRQGWCPVPLPAHPQASHLEVLTETDNEAQAFVTGNLFIGDVEVPGIRIVLDKSGGQRSATWFVTDFRHDGAELTHRAR